MQANGRSIGVFNVDGHLFALRNTCPHQGAQLCLGTVRGTMLPSDPYEYRYGRDGRVLRCPWHGWEYDLKSGQSWVDPASVRVRSYDVGIESTEPADIEIDPDTGYAKGPFLAETYPVSIDKLNVVLDLP